MSHKTLVNGTVYEVDGGKTLIDGVAYSIDKGKTLVDGTVYEVGFVKAVSAEGEVLDDWATIASGANVANYSIGNWKLITLTDGTEVVMEIAAFNADTKADGSTAAITWISKHVVTSHVMNSTSTNANGWVVSAMRTWLQGDFYNTLPSEVRSVIQTVNKTYYDYTTKSTLECEDSLWIPSRREIGSTLYETSGPNYVEHFGELPQKCDSNGAEIAWWTRTAHTAYGTRFYSVMANGGGGQNNANTSAGVVLCFCT